ncbi:MAG: hypothetical protein ABUL60_31935 [Myxococcales bacterium]
MGLKSISLSLLTSAAFTFLVGACVPEPGDEQVGDFPRKHAGGAAGSNAATAGASASGSAGSSTAGVSAGGNLAPRAAPLVRQVAALASA